MCNPELFSSLNRSSRPGTRAAVRFNERECSESDTSMKSSGSVNERKSKEINNKDLTKGTISCTYDGN